MNNVLKASSSFVQTDTNIKVIGSCEWCDLNPCVCTKSGCWSCIETYDEDAILYYFALNNSEERDDIYHCRNKCQYCGTCRCERSAAQKARPYVDPNDDFFDDYHPKHETQCPYVKITTKSLFRPSSLFSATTSETTPSIS